MRVPTLVLRVVICHAEGCYPRFEGSNPLERWLPPSRPLVPIIHGHGSYQPYRQFGWVLTKRCSAGGGVAGQQVSPTRFPYPVGVSKLC